MHPGMPMGQQSVSEPMQQMGTRSASGVLCLLCISASLQSGDLSRQHFMIQPMRQPGNRESPGLSCMSLAHLEAFRKIICSNGRELCNLRSS